MRKIQINSNRELLNGQKPKKRLSTQRISLKTFIITICLLTLSLVFYVAKIDLKPLITPSILNQDYPWHLKINHVDKKLQVDEKERNKIESSFKTSIESNGSKLNLRDLAKTIIKDSMYKKVHIFQDQSKSLVISLSDHTPLMTINIGKLKFISDSFVVFGDATGSDLVELEGLKIEIADAQGQSHPNELILDDRNRKLVEEAANLKTLVEKQNIKIKKIMLKKYRGFYILTKESNIVISFGHKPFEGKIEKLIRILQDLSKSSRVASTIELDFDDKAFVRELKL